MPTQQTTPKAAEALLAQLVICSVCLTASLPPLPRNPFPAPILDSGCTLHLSGHLQLLHKFAPHPPRSISVTNNNSVMSYSSGIIRGHIVIDGRLEPVQIKNVLHVPDIPHTLISPLQLEDGSTVAQWLWHQILPRYTPAPVHHLTRLAHHTTNLL